MTRRELDSLDTVLDRDTDDTGHLAPATSPKARAFSKLRFRLPGRFSGTRWIVAVLLVLLVAFGSFWGYGYVKDGPIRDAFDRSQSRLQVANAGVAEAVDLDGVRAAGEMYAGLVPDLKAAVNTAGARNSELGRAAGGVLEAQLRLAESGAGLVELVESDLGSWPETRSSLASAVGMLDEARADLARVDGDRAATAELPKGTLGHLDDLVGTAFVANSRGSFEALFTELATAKTTDQLRHAASTASTSEAGTRAVLKSFDEGSADQVRLDRYAEVYAAVAGLNVIDGAHLSMWADARAALVAAADLFVDGDESLSGGLRAAVGSIDRLVESAQSKLRSWRARYDQASEAKRRDVSAIDTYNDSMKAQLGRYSTLRASLSTWIDRVEDPTNFVSYDEGYDVLFRAQTDREKVRDALSAMAVPNGLSGVHNDVLSVIDSGIAAVSAAYQGTVDAQWCTYTCYYEDSPGWQTFTAESSRITGTFKSAVGDWESAYEKAHDATSNRALPERPVV